VSCAHVVELVRFCLRRVQAAFDPQVAASLRGIAKEYQRRAAGLKSGELPASREDRPSMPPPGAEPPV